MIMKWPKKGQSVIMDDPRGEIYFFYTEEGFKSLSGYDLLKQKKNLRKLLMIDSHEVLITLTTIPDAFVIGQVVTKAQSGLDVDYKVTCIEEITLDDGFVAIAIVGKPLYQEVNTMLLKTEQFEVTLTPQDALCFHRLKKGAKDITIMPNQWALLLERLTEAHKPGRLDM